MLNLYFVVQMTLQNVSYFESCSENVHPVLRKTKRTDHPYTLVMFFALSNWNYAKASIKKLSAYDFGLELIVHCQLLRYKISLD